MFDMIYGSDRTQVARCPALSRHVHPPLGPTDADGVVLAGSFPPILARIAS